MDTASQYHFFILLTNSLSEYPWIVLAQWWQINPILFGHIQNAELPEDWIQTQWWQGQWQGQHRWLG